LRGHLVVAVRVFRERRAGRRVCVTTEPSLGRHGRGVWNVGFADLININIVGTTTKRGIVASTSDVAVGIGSAVRANECVATVARVSSPNGSVTEWTSVNSF
jgi:hypothetical protein